MNKCPKCENGVIVGLSFEVGLIEIPCPLCNGTEEISYEKLRWHNRGKELRELRRKTLKKGPSEVAKLLGISPSLLSRMENGREEPKECYFEMMTKEVEPPLLSPMAAAASTIIGIILGTLAAVVVLLVIHIIGTYMLKTP